MPLCVNLRYIVRSRFYCRQTFYTSLGVCMGVLLGIVLAPALDGWCKTHTDEYVVVFQSGGDPSYENPKKRERPYFLDKELGIGDPLLVTIRLSSSDKALERAKSYQDLFANSTATVFFFVSRNDIDTADPWWKGVKWALKEHEDELAAPFLIDYLGSHEYNKFTWHLLINDATFVYQRSLARFLLRTSPTTDNIFYESSSHALPAPLLFSNQFLRHFQTAKTSCEAGITQCLHDTTRSVLTSLSSAGTISRKIEAPIQVSWYDSLFMFYPLEHTEFTVSVSKLMADEATSLVSEKTVLRENLRRQHTLLPEDIRKRADPFDAHWSQLVDVHYDVMRWHHYNKTHRFFDNDFENAGVLTAEDKSHIDLVLSQLPNRITYDELYWRFDTERGIDYVFHTTNANGEQEVVRSLRPLAALKSHAMPFVSEDSNVLLLCVVQPETYKFSTFFLNNFRTLLDMKEKANVVFLLLRHEKVDEYSSLKSEIDQLPSAQADYIHWIAAETSTKSLVTIYAAVANRFQASGPLFLVTPDTIVTHDLLNRIRIMTIKEQQSYSPIPFVQYNPAISVTALAVPPTYFEVNATNGVFDSEDFNLISFYSKDFQECNKEFPKVTDITELFFQCKVRLLRAVEPGARKLYSLLICAAEDISCLSRNMQRQGSQKQLAAKLFPPDEVIISEGVK